MMKGLVSPASPSLYNHSCILYQQWIHVPISIQCGKHTKGEKEGKINVTEMHKKRVQIDHVILSFQELFLCLAQTTAPPSTLPTTHPSLHLVYRLQAHSIFVVVVVVVLF